MTAEVVSLAAWKEENGPHLAGSARCISCRHEWVSVAPVGTVWLDCPSCGMAKGRLVNPVLKDGLHWHCLCGNDIFYCHADGFYCPNCGEWQYGDEDGGPKAS